MFVIKTRVGPSTIHGIGVFACEDVPAGCVVWQFHPPFDQVLSQLDIAGLPEIAREYLEIYAYRCLDLGGKLVLSGDHARFLNHNDDPNTEERPFASIARRPIVRGEEITCDYGAFCTGWTGFGTEPHNTQASRSKMTDAMPHRNLYTRLKVSAHGVGVFAIKDIPNRLRLFEGDASTVVRVPLAAVDQIQDAEVRRMYFDFCPMHDGYFIAPVDFNQLTMAWYMNHSDNANVQIDDTMQFIACRPIAAGEELTTDYTSFSDHALPLIAQWHITGKP
jgi:hypothetical protein